MPNFKILLPSQTDLPDNIVSGELQVKIKNNQLGPLSTELGITEIENVDFLGEDKDRVYAEFHWKDNEGNLVDKHIALFTVGKDVFPDDPDKLGFQMVPVVE